MILENIFCLQEIGVHAPNMLTIRSSIANMIVGTYMTHLMSTRIFTLILNRRFIQTLKILRKMSTGTKVFANHLALIVFSISYEKWAQREKYLNNTRLPYTWFSLGNLWIPPCPCSRRPLCALSPGRSHCWRGRHEHWFLERIVDTLLMWWLSDHLVQMFPPQSGPPVGKQCSQSREKQIEV